MISRIGVPGGGADNSSSSMGGSSREVRRRVCRQGRRISASAIGLPPVVSPPTMRARPSTSRGTGAAHRYSGLLRGRMPPQQRRAPDREKRWAWRPPARHRDRASAPARWGPVRARAARRPLARRRPASAVGPDRAATSGRRGSRRPVASPLSAPGSGPYSWFPARRRTGASVAPSLPSCLQGLPQGNELTGHVECRHDCQIASPAASPETRSPWRSAASSPGGLHAADQRPIVLQAYPRSGGRPAR